jgi:hypothetical protein
MAALLSASRRAVLLMQLKLLSQVTDYKEILQISTQTGDNFVDKAPLTRQTASNGAIFLKLPVQKADPALNGINDLRTHR